MENIPVKVDGNQVTTAEYNSIVAELKNIITNAGIALNGADSEQVVKALSNYGSSIRGFVPTRDDANSFTWSTGVFRDTNGKIWKPSWSTLQKHIATGPNVFVEGNNQNGGGSDTLTWQIWAYLIYKNSDPTVLDIFYHTYTSGAITPPTGWTLLKRIGILIGDDSNVWDNFITRELPDGSLVNEIFVTQTNPGLQPASTTLAYFFPDDNDSAHIPWTKGQNTTVIFDCLLIDSTPTTRTDLWIGAAIAAAAGSHPGFTARNPTMTVDVGATIQSLRVEVRTGYNNANCIAVDFSNTDADVILTAGVVGWIDDRMDSV